MSKSNEFEYYLQLLSQIDQKFKEVHSRYSSDFSCRSGCFGCCKAGLTVNNVESVRIQKWLESRADLRDRLKDLREKRIHGPEYCSYLGEDGACLIYDVRPVVCRSHGLPTLVPNVEDSEVVDGDVCPLNFKDRDLGGLNANDWIRLDTLNLILAAINKEFDPNQTEIRVKLEEIPLSTSTRNSNET